MTIFETTKLAPAKQRAERSLIWLGAVTTGVVVTNLFAPQILVGLIGRSLAMTAWQAGLVSTLTLLGYALGLLLLVPLVDLIENRRLILRTLGCAILAALATALAPTPSLLLLATFVLGASCAAIQMMVPLVASMVAPERRGQAIGEVMSGLMIGILLSRPAASLIADLWSWRAYYLLSAILMALLLGALGRYLPTLQPAAGESYGELLRSFPRLLREEPVLRVRAWTAALVMASFTAFWAAVALRLPDVPFALDAKGIAAFALIGVAGAAATSLAGRWGDKGWARPMFLAAHLLIIASLALCAWAGVMESRIVALLVLSLGTILLDVGITTDQTLGRRAINLLRPEARGRINGLFVALFFIGGGVGAAAASLAWTYGGWTMVCVVAASFGVLGLLTDLMTRTGTS
ncbi:MULTISPECIES: MFS transporter [unclassified Bradyrhizobium]|uniref:MFS transporter n=1 Tax=unclassified Bradyrhizobium TaxID=2631580 RepID=UPI00247AC2B5|nr:MULTISPECIES: MFS transporter [unclassified Bradyrhizobium]WGR68420.1 MFS transporter [Bradyrhizobium sp. ISRA426]WGR80475.1 MFS transporter [Bradyrhizobium sp. ISRA430]WGR83660.1 MFS transporter [Bradyrhizobium sp. ISRA432]